MSRSLAQKSPRPASPQRRQFDATQFLCAAHHDYPDSEDTALTAYLERLLDEHLSSRHEPLPERCPQCGAAKIRAHCKPNRFMALPKLQCVLTEDPRLPLFLESIIAQVFSQDVTPPVCPHCAGTHTRLTAARPPGGAAPQFGCHSCGRHFTRLVGTPPARLTRKDGLSAFVRLLSQQRPLPDAIRELSLSEQTASPWVEKCRLWLLQLDPSGAYEQLVKLGVKPPAPVLYCPHCREEREMAYHGYAPITRFYPMHNARDNSAATAAGDSPAWQVPRYARAATANRPSSTPLGSPYVA